MSSPSPLMRRAVVTRVLAVVVGAVLAVVVAVAVVPPSEPADTSDVGASVGGEVRSELLERWERWRRATASFTEVTTRSESGGRDLTTSVEIAQRFPDRLVRSGSDVSGRLDGRLVGCTVRPAATTCFDTGGFRPEDELAVELRRLADSTAGADPPYRVSRTTAGCYRLRHVGPELRPPWGDRLDICFDAATGVATREVQVSGSLTTDVRRDDIDPRPGTEAFELPTEPVQAPA